MVIFDQLRLSDDSKRMYINMHINTAEYFDNVYLDTLTITTAEKFSETTVPTPENHRSIYNKTFDANTKSADLVLCATDFIKTWGSTASEMAFTQEEMSKTLFFLYVKVTGTPGENCPCNLDNEYTIAVTFDAKLLYQMVMGYVKELTQECAVHQGFIDFILLWNAFKAAIETDHWITAIKFWNMLLGNIGNTNILSSHKCNCHG